MDEQKELIEIIKKSGFSNIQDRKDLAEAITKAGYQKVGREPEKEKADYEDIGMVQSDDSDGTSENYYFVCVGEKWGKENNGKRVRIEIFIEDKKDDGIRQGDGCDDVPYKIG